MLTPTADLVAAAAAAGTGIPAFNGITLEHGEAIVAGAEQAGRPVILALSHNAVRFHQDALEPIAAGYRLPADKAALYRQGYAANPRSLDLIGKATAPAKK